MKSAYLPITAITIDTLQARPISPHPVCPSVFTKTAWYAIPAFWIPVIAYLAWPFARDSGIVLTLALIGVGIFLWTLAEYSIHRFLFHLDDALPNVRPLLLVHFLLHGVHHKVPMDRYRLVMPQPSASSSRGASTRSFGQCSSPFRLTRTMQRLRGG